MLFLSIFIFITGLLMLYTYRKNYLFMIISLELLLLSINYLLLGFSEIWQDSSALYFVLYILIIAAIESVIGLSILILYYRRVNSVEELQKEEEKNENH